MLFVLDESLAKNLGDKSVQEALYYIALGRCEGKHLVFCEKMGIMKTFAESEDISAGYKFLCAAFILCAFSLWLCGFV